MSIRHGPLKVNLSDLVIKQNRRHLPRSRSKKSSTGGGDESSLTNNSHVRLWHPS